MVASSAEVIKIKDKLNSLKSNLDSEMVEFYLNMGHLSLKIYRQRIDIDHSLVTSQMTLEYRFVLHGMMILEKFT